MHRGFDVVIKLLIIKPHGQVENIRLVETRGIQLITRRVIPGVPLIYKFTPLFLPCWAYTEEHHWPSVNLGSALGELNCQKMKLDWKPVNSLWPREISSPILGGPFGMGQDEDSKSLQVFIEEWYLLWGMREGDSKQNPLCVRGAIRDIWTYSTQKKYFGYLHDLERNPYEFFQTSFTV